MTEVHEEGREEVRDSIPPTLPQLKRLFLSSYYNDSVVKEYGRSLKCTGDYVCQIIEFFLRTSGPLLEMLKKISKEKNGRYNIKEYDDKKEWINFLLYSTEKSRILFITSCNKSKVFPSLLFGIDIYKHEDHQIAIIGFYKKQDEHTNLKHGPCVIVITSSTSYIILIGEFSNDKKIRHWIYYDTVEEELYYRFYDDKTILIEAFYDNDDKVILNFFSGLDKDNESLKATVKL